MATAIQSTDIPGTSASLDSCFKLRKEVLNLEAQLKNLSLTLSDWNRELLDRSADSDHKLVHLQLRMEAFIDGLYKRLQTERRYGVELAEKEFLQAQQRIMLQLKHCESLVRDINELTKHNDHDTAMQEYLRIMGEVKQMLAGVPDLKDLATLKAWKDIDIPTVMINVHNSPIAMNNTVKEQGTNTDNMHSSTETSSAPVVHITPAPLGECKRFISVSEETLRDVPNTEGLRKNSLYSLHGSDNTSRVALKHRQPVLTLNHEWTYRCDCYEESSGVRFTDVIMMPNGQVCAIDDQMCQLVCFDGSTGNKLCQQSFKHGNPLASKIKIKPFAMALDSTENMFLSDKKNKCVQMFSIQGRQLWHRDAIGEGLVHKPRGVAVTNQHSVVVIDKSFGNVFIFDAHSRRLIQKCEMSKIVAEHVSRQCMPVLEYVATDETRGCIYVSDSSMQLIHVMDLRSNKYLCSFGNNKNNYGGSLINPNGLCVDEDRGHIFVADYSCNSTQESGRVAIFNCHHQLIEYFSAPDYHPRAVRLSKTRHNQGLLVTCQCETAVSRYQLGQVTDQVVTKL